jgi:hypothetical protein
MADEILFSITSSSEDTFDVHMSKKFLKWLRIPDDGPSIQTIRDSLTTIASVLDKAAYVEEEKDAVARKKPRTPRSHRASHLRRV